MERNDFYNQPTQFKIIFKQYSNNQYINIFYSNVRKE